MFTLCVQHLRRGRTLGDDAFQYLQRPRQIEGQPTPALRFGDINARAVLKAVLMFVFVARGLTNRDLRQQFAVLLGKRADEISPGRMSCELRRLHLHALIERLPKTHRFRLANEGLRTALFYNRVRESCIREWPQSYLYRRPVHRKPGGSSMSQKTLSIPSAIKPTLPRRETWLNQIKISLVKESS